VLVVPSVVVPATPRVPVFEVFENVAVPLKTEVPALRVNVEILALFEILIVVVVPAYRVVI